MTCDGLKNLQITYNILNSPEYISKSGTTINYSWFADGSKYMVTSAGKGYRYIGSLIYTIDLGKLEIESTDFAGGRINFAEAGAGGSLTQEINYFHTDHLGSVRAITNQEGSVIEQNAYYPFGSRHTFGNTYAQTTNRFKFNGKEEQTSGNLGLLDYGARMYDANIGRWFVQDPLSEKYYSQSPYNYCVNNPVMFVDPDGRDVNLSYMTAKSHIEALDKLLQTSEGYEFISRYMKKGQALSVNGNNYHFEIDGDRAKDILYFKSQDLGNHILGKNVTFHKYRDENLSTSVPLDVDRVASVGVRQVVYLHSKLDKVNSIATLAHEVFVHTSFSADMLSVFDNMSTKSYKNLQDISNKANIDHSRLGNDELYKYRNFMKKQGLLKMYYDDVKRYK